MINLHKKKKMLLDMAEVESMTAWSSVNHASDLATKTGLKALLDKT